MSPVPICENRPSPIRIVLTLELVYSSKFFCGSFRFFVLKLTVFSKRVVFALKYLKMRTNHVTHERLVALAKLSPTAYVGYFWL